MRNSESFTVIDLKQKRKGDYVSIRIEYEETKQPSNWLDIYSSKIGQIYGGQETRLAIAIQLFELVIYNKSILVLDEPEQGSDPPIAYKLIKSICKKYSRQAMIVIISHLERFGGHEGMENASGIQWDNTIFVDNGVVSVSKDC